MLTPGIFISSSSVSDEHKDVSFPMLSGGMAGNNEAFKVSLAEPHPFETSTVYSPGVLTKKVESVDPSCHNQLSTSAKTGTIICASPGHNCISLPRSITGDGPPSRIITESLSDPQLLLTVRLYDPGMVTVNEGSVVPSLHK